MLSRMTFTVAALLLHPQHPHRPHPQVLCPRHCRPPGMRRCLRRGRSEGLGAEQRWWCSGVCAAQSRTTAHAHWLTAQDPSTEHAAQLAPRTLFQMPCSSWCSAQRWFSTQSPATLMSSALSAATARRRPASSP